MKIIKELNSIIEKKEIKNMNKYVKNILYGFMSWLIPFIASIFFYSNGGELTIDIFLFKSIMVVIGSFSASILLIYYFRNIKIDYLKEGIIVGLLWLCINIIMDLLILIPISGMSIANYFMQIGLMYLAIPAMSFAVGTSLENKK